MPRGGRPDEAVADIASRRDALRQAAGLPGADLRSLVEAALTEIDAAIEAIGTAPPGAGGGSADAAEVLPESVRAERRLLHAVFQQAPVPLFLLEQDGTIRRANNKAADLLGAPSGYATGKSVSVFVDLPFRAAIQTLLAAVTRTGKPRSAACRMLTASGPVDVTLTAARGRPARRPAGAHRHRRAWPARAGRRARTAAADKAEPGKHGRERSRRSRERRTRRRPTPPSRP